MDSTDHNEQEYLEFIKVTRKHQAERERIKKLERKKNPPVEEYYIDLSQVSTIVQDNLVEAPQKDDGESNKNIKERELIDLYGGKESYDKIRSLEMYIDDHFKNKCQELSPYYWPVIPINPKPYLNPIRN